jgi:hypothetical protein
MDVRTTRSSDEKDSGALGLERIGRRRAAIARIAGKRNLAAVALGTLLTLTPTILIAEDATPPPDELIELLEYVGSWDGAEEDWVLFLGDASDPEFPTDADIEPLTSEAESGGTDAPDALAPDAL